MIDRDNNVAERTHLVLYSTVGGLGYRSLYDLRSFQEPHA